MRDINRIDSFCKELATMWKRVPDWRFGQLMSNFLGDVYCMTNKDVFYIEDDELLEYVEEFYKLEDDEPEKSTMMVTYEEFKRLMGRIVEFYNFTDTISSLAIHMSDSTEIWIDGLISEATEMLSKLTNDHGEWIYYWVYELRCGKDYEDGMIEDKDGNDIPLKTIDDLWEVLKRGIS